MNTIETARVYLRPFTFADLDAFALICSDPDVMRYIGAGRPLSSYVKDARFYNSDLRYYAITREEYQGDGSV